MRQKSTKNIYLALTIAAILLIVAGVLATVIFWGEISDSILAEMISCVLLVFTALMASIMIKTQISSDREETRRVKTVELGQWFTERTAAHPEWSVIRSMMREMNPVACSAIRSNFSLSSGVNQTFRMTDDLRDRMAALLQGLQGIYSIDIGYLIDAIKTSKSKTIPNEVLAFMRHGLLSYLNTLEVVAVAWSQAVVDKEHIEQEFCFVNNTALVGYLDAHGYRGFTELASLIKTLEQKKRMSGKGGKETQW